MEHEARVYDGVPGPHLRDHFDRFQPGVLFRRECRHCARLVPSNRLAAAQEGFGVGAGSNCQTAAVDGHGIQCQPDVHTGPRAVSANAAHGKAL
eukprot:1188627-Prorocentrum_minimum.AAC.1